MKNQKGITLVALVVTIIVLLILAAVSLSLVAGSDGLLNRASNAVDQTQLASAKEQAELAIETAIADYYYNRYAADGNTINDMANNWTLAKYVAANIASYASAVSDATLTCSTAYNDGTASFMIRLANGDSYVAQLDDSGTLGNWVKQ